MKCPHCLVEFHDKTDSKTIGQDVEGYYDIEANTCPSCKRIIFYLAQYTYSGHIRIYKQRALIRPKMANRPPVPSEVPTEYANDYKEACLVLEDSPKASAALSRRCIQSIIRLHLGIKRKDLNQEIQEVIDNKLFPSDILESIDAIRNIGNFAAHPIKSNSTGEILEVEPNEADWNLDVLEMVFDFLFVRPAIVKKKKDALNAKLKDSGKPDMK